MQQALELNNQGVDSLLEGDYTTALQSLTAALRILRASPVLPFCSTNKPARSKNVVTFGTVPGLAEASGTPVLDQAVRVHVDNDNDNDNDYRWTTACIIFNMALWHHARYAIHGDDASVLAKAQTLYEKADQCLEDCYYNEDDDDCNSHHAGLILALRLAAVNNSAVLQQRQGNLSGAQEAFEYLLLLCQHIAVVVQEKQTSIFHQDLLREIQTNAILGSQAVAVLMDGTTAPAA